MLSGYGLYTNGLELDAIASVVIGGTMLTGGVGYVIGTGFGVLIQGLVPVSYKHLKVATSGLGVDSVGAGSFKKKKYRISEKVET